MDSVKRLPQCQKLELELMVCMMMWAAHQSVFAGGDGSDGKARCNTNSLSSWWDKGFFYQSASDADLYGVHTAPVCNHVHQHLCT